MATLRDLTGSLALMEQIYMEISKKNKLHLSDGKQGTLEGDVTVAENWFYGEPRGKFSTVDKDGKIIMKRIYTDEGKLDGHCILYTDNNTTRESLMFSGSPQFQMCKTRDDGSIYLVLLDSNYQEAGIGRILYSDGRQ